MKRYSAARKSTVIQKMMPPKNIPISELVTETGISDVTLYKWRREARVEGLAVPGDGKNPEKWTSEDKFAVVLETASLNEIELGKYCREQGLYAEQIRAWREACLKANANSAQQAKAQRLQTKKERKKINQLEKELWRKEKALAETAALLVLKKKAQAIWGESEDA